MSLITLNSTISHRVDIMTSDLHNEMVMMNVDRGAYYGLEEVGTRIWKHLAQPMTVADLVARLMDEYSMTDRETCVRDTLDFLNQLQAEDLLVHH